MRKEYNFNAKELVMAAEKYAKSLQNDYGVLLVSVLGLNKGQTVKILTKNSDSSVVIPHGYKHKYTIPSKYIMLPGEDIEYPRCQEIDELWNNKNN